MDQLKEILKQAIKYRFWIAAGLSALLPMIAYFVGVGDVKAKTATQTAAIKAADSDVKQYGNGTVPNGQYKPIVDEKTGELSKDVNESWKKLYARQAPLLTWPKTVHDRFTTWGRNWPKDVDASNVQIAIIDYVTAYDAFANNEVFKACNPFDPIEGTGVVVAGTYEQLLRPAPFKIETPPTLGKVWAAQERLWVQRTLLDVVAQVNKNAKDWDGAVIKQIVAVEVGNQLSQDQRSMAKGDTLVEAAEINDPDKPVEAAPEAAATTDVPAGYGGMMRGMGMSGGGYGAGASGSAESVFYIKTDSTQFQVLPVQMTIFIDQDHIQDFLVAMENSPMTVQVMDFEMAKPSTRVEKPVKGGPMNMGYGGYGGMSGYGRGGEMSGYGGMMPGGMTGFGGRGMMGGYGGEMMGPGMGAGMGMGMRGGAAPKKGLDKRAENIAKKEADRLAAFTKGKSAATIQDPFYNIVEVKVYGQARFFMPPPPDAPAEPSLAEGATPPPAPADAEKKDEAPKADAEKKDEVAKPEAEKKDEATKPGTEKPEVPKTDVEKKEAPKTDVEKKEDVPKADPGVGVPKS